MPTYPIRVPRRAYRGADTRKLRQRDLFNELASRLERYVNAEFEKRGENRLIFTYTAIANELNLKTKQVSDVLSAVDGGHTGLTVTKE